MSEHLPQHVDGYRLARQGGRVHGTVPVSRLTRLGTFLCSDRGTAEAELEFGVDATGVAFVRGRARAELDLTCQRCLETMVEPVEAQFCLGMVASEGLAARLPEVYEPLVTDDAPLGVWTLVEDELILALPIVPRHAPEVCPAALPQEPGPEADEQRPNPFAALEQLRKKGSTD